jgi:ribosome assembly protein YihI (activator of Der GTPase)
MGYQTEAERYEVPSASEKKKKKGKKRGLSAGTQSDKKSSNEHGMIIAQKQASKRKNIGTPQKGTFKPIPQMTADADQGMENTDKPETKTAFISIPSPGETPNPKTHVDRSS